MKAIVHTAYSADVDLDTYVSDDPKNDGVWIRLLVGPTDDPADGEESFDVLVCTPLWLRDVVRRKGPQVGRHHLIVEHLDIRTALDYLRHQVESLEADDWAALTDKISRLAFWEFEDYRA